MSEVIRGEVTLPFVMKPDGSRITLYLCGDEENFSPSWPFLPCGEDYALQVDRNDRSKAVSLDVYGVHHLHPGFHERVLLESEMEDD
jgi:hypothetical protein